MIEEKGIKEATKITISKSPKEIELKNIKIEEHKCFINSFRVAKKYPNVKIVEGFIILIDKENKAKALPHVWNIKDQVSFDVTKDKIWIGKEENSKIKEIKYFSIQIFSHTNFKNEDIFEFCPDTYWYIEDFTMALNKKDKINKKKN